MPGNRWRPRIPLPKQWPSRVRSGVLHAISLAHFSLTFTRSWAANSINARIRLKQESDRLRQELALLREEMPIKDARMLPPINRTDSVSLFAPFTPPPRLTLPPAKGRRREIPTYSPGRCLRAAGLRERAGAATRLRRLGFPWAARFPQVGLVIATTNGVLSGKDPAVLPACD